MQVRILALFAVVLMAGCASNPMALSPQQELQPPPADKAQVVFMRSSFVGSAISATLYEVSNGDIEFIGVLVDGAKIAYQTTPGDHAFMVVSEAADFMEADLSAGKTYYSIVTPRMGMWKARFSLWPIKTSPDAEFHTGMDDFEKWVSKTKFMDNTDKSRAWYEGNKDSVKSKYEEYLPVWMNKSAEDLAERTLVPEDGM
jgi:hypothetical protein